MKLIERPFYINKLLQVKGTADIKVITGIRRCGKSKLLESFINHIKETEPDANIVSIDFNFLEFEPLLEYHTLYNHILGQYQENTNNYVFIDEIQMCPSFEKCVNSLHATGKFDLYITGSNAFLLSSDLATLFTGRTFSIEVFPFSYNEFLTYYGETASNVSFTRFMLEGGMAGSYLYPAQNDKYRYINNEVFNSLIIRDLQTKYRIKNKLQLDKTIDFLLDNIGNLTSIRNVARTLCANQMHIDDKTIGKYIDYLCKAFAFYKVNRYDIKGKKYLASESKYYLSDHSFRYARLGVKNLNWGRTIENIVAIELLRRGYEIYVGVLQKKEIDFVAVRQNEKIYIQVSDDIQSEQTFQREVQPLLLIHDAYPKVILARTNQPDYCYEGVWIKDISQWLYSL